MGFAHKHIRTDFMKDIFAAFEHKLNAAASAVRFVYVRSPFILAFWVVRQENRAPPPGWAGLPSNENQT